MVTRHTNYQQINDGDKILIETDQELHLSCCDCGLTHEFIFKKVRRGVEIIINRKDRITASIRRHNKFKK
jgi:uncharacterized Zn finger protein